MSDGLQFPIARRYASRGFVVFALLALFLVMARPICDVYELQGSPSESGLVAADHAHGEASHHEDSKPCCASVEDGTLTVPSTTMSSAVKSSPSIPALTASLPQGRAAARLLSELIPPDRPPDPQPYYARSARILI